MTDRSMPLQPFGLLLIAASAGCLPYGRTREAPVPLDLPETYRIGEDLRELPELDPAPKERVDQAWWKDFEDPVLDELIDTALRGSFELSATFRRLEQARALVVQVRSAQFPQAGIQGQLNHARAISPFFGANITTTAVASLPVSYEVDWFARAAGETEATRIDARAVQDDYEAAAITLSARVAEAYFDLVEARAQRELLRAQLEVNETFLELVLLRFQRGLTTALDIHQQRQLVAAQRAQIELVLAREEVAQNQLAILVGKVPGEVALAPDREALPVLTTRPPEGVPADLLSARPDLRAAAQRIRAADERVATAIASRLPSLVISAAPGYKWLRIESPLTDPILPGAPAFGGVQTAHGLEWSVGGMFNFPLFDGFQRRGLIRARRAQVEEALDFYAQSLQVAVGEVRNALAQEGRQHAQIVDLEAQVEAATAMLESARDRYRQGLSDFLPVLTALQTLQQAEVTLLTARRQLLSFRVQLHRAMGGAINTDLDRRSREEHAR